jgi:hypothetical protein
VFRLFFHVSQSEGIIDKGNTKMKITVEYIEVEGKQVRVNTFPSGQKEYGWEDENGDMQWSAYKPETTEEREAREERLRNLPRPQFLTTMLASTLAVGLVPPSKRDN